MASLFQNIAIGAGRVAEQDRKELAARDKEDRNFERQMAMLNQQADRADQRAEQAARDKERVLGLQQTFAKTQADAQRDYAEKNAEIAKVTEIVNSLANIAKQPGGTLTPAWRLNTQLLRDLMARSHVKDYYKTTAESLIPKVVTDPDGTVAELDKINQEIQEEALPEAIEKQTKILADVNDPNSEVGKEFAKLSTDEKLRKVKSPDLNMWQRLGEGVISTAEGISSGIGGMFDTAADAADKKQAERDARKQELIDNGLPTVGQLAELFIKTGDRDTVAQMGRVARGGGITQTTPRSQFNTTRALDYLFGEPAGPVAPEAPVAPVAPVTSSQKVDSRDLSSGFTPPPQTPGIGGAVGSGNRIDVAKYLPSGNAQ